jgi:hypothetical protein
MRREEYPRWMRIVGNGRALVICIVLIGIGVRYIVAGNAGGRLIGIVLVVVFGGWALRVAVWPFAKRFAKPS